MFILSIDIGILHLGLSFTCVDETFENPVIECIQLVDITRYACNKNVECNLYHTNNLCDRINHFIFDYLYYFDKSDFILIEQQPITGLVSVEQLLLEKFRTKTIKVHPSKMHRRFNIHMYDYDTRKLKTEEISKRYLSPRHQLELDAFERAHDITDSICIMLYWIHTKHEELCKLQRKEKLHSDFLNYTSMSMGDFFDQYKFKTK